MFDTTFTSTFKPRLDEKGRFFLPAKFRDKFVSGLVVTRGELGNLVIYPRDEFDRQIERITANSSNEAELQRALVRLGELASLDAPDKQGRLTLSAEQREFAAIDRDLVVIGSITHVQIWSPERHADFRARTEPSV